MCARFSAFLLVHAIFTHCISLSVVSESPIIAERKEPLSPLIIDSKLNQIITIYVPVIKGTKAVYYLTNPIGEERRLNIQNKIKKKLKNHRKHIHHVTQNFIKFNNKLVIGGDNVSVISLVLNREIKTNNSQLNFYKHRKDHIRDATIIEKDLNRKLYDLENKHDDNIYVNTYNSTIEPAYYYENQRDVREMSIKIEPQQYYAYVETKHKIHQSKTVNKSEYDNRNSQIVKDQNGINSKKYLDFTKIKDDYKGILKMKPIKILKEFVEVINVWEYDDEHFKTKRNLRGYFNIGPLLDDDHGNWVLSIFYKNGSSWVEMYQVITINIFESIPAKQNKIRLKQGEDYIVSFSHPIKRLQSCQLIGPRASEKYYERYGEPEYCGYIVKNVTNTEEGAWSIIGVGKIIYETKTYLHLI